MRELKQAGKKVNATTLAELEAEPPLYDDLLPYWFAFFNLNKERKNNGFTICPLSLQDILLELKLNNLPCDRYGVTLIRTLDDQYIEWVHANYFDKEKKGVTK